MHLQIISLDPAQVLGTDAVLRRGHHVVSPAHLLDLATSEGQCAAMGEIAVDAVASRGLAQGRHRVLEEQSLAGVRVESEFIDHRRRRRGKQGRDPAPIATRGPESAHARFENCDTQVRVATQQFSRSPQSRVAPADNRHVNVNVAPQ